MFISLEVAIYLVIFFHATSQFYLSFAIILRDVYRLALQFNNEKSYLFKIYIFHQRFHDTLLLVSIDFFFFLRRNYYELLNDREISIILYVCNEIRIIRDCFSLRKYCSKNVEIFRSLDEIACLQYFLIPGILLNDKWCQERNSISWGDPRHV